MAQYAVKAVSLRTGRVLGDVPLTQIRAEKRLDVGAFSASLRLPRAATVQPQRSRDLAKCRGLLAATTPGVQTVIVVRDGKILGEWWLETRDRSQSPMPIGGHELKQWFFRAAVDGFATMTNVDQLTLAVALANNALAKPFAPPITVEDPGLSGNIITKAEHPTGSAYIGDIINDYATAIDGFDWWVDTDWDTTATVPTVKRTLRFAWPRRGRLIQARIDVPARSAGQSGVSAAVTEDVSRLATTVYMTGTGEDDTQLVSRGQNNDLYAAYPSLDFIDDRADFEDQAVLDAATAAEAAGMRTVELPTTIRVRATGDVPLGVYEPGDTLPVAVEPVENFPDGLTENVRIVGFAIQPPAAGATEMVDIELTRDDDNALHS
jgi:hypothetical protein